MEENRKIMTCLLAAGILFLIGTIGYPYLKEFRQSRTAAEVSLEMENDETQQPDAEKGLPQEQQADKPPLRAAEGGGKAIPQLLLCAQGENGKIETSLWQSASGICYFFLPGFAGESRLNFEIEKESLLRIGGKEVRSGDRLKNIEWEQAYDLELWNRDEEMILDTQVIFMYSSQLPVLSMTTATGSMETIDALKGNEETGAIELLSADGTVVYAGEAQSISGRGNSTWGLLKKPYQFQLMSAADLLGSGEAKAWNLLANGYDDTKLRNKIALDMANELGAAYVPDGQMIDLYMNHIYYGNYYLTEKITVGEESVDIRDMEKVSGEAYTPAELEKLVTLENEDGTRKWTGMQYEEPDLTGGYLIERELPDRFETENSGFITDEGDCYVLQSPAYATENQVNYIGDFVQELEDALKDPDGVNRKTGKHYLEYMDLSSFAKKYLVEEISKNYDGGVTSSFFYKPQDASGTKLYAGPVWDYDAAFGNCNLDEIAGNPEGLTKLNNHVLGTQMFARLYEQEEFYLAVVELYKEKALPYLNRLLDGEIDRLAEECRQSVKLDGIRWEELENRYRYYKEYDNNVRYLKYFIENRRDFLNEVWLEGVVYHNIHFAVEGESWQVYSVKDGETAGHEPVPSKNGSLFMGWWTEDGIPYDPYKPVYEDKIFYALWQEIQKEP